MTLLSIFTSVYMMIKAFMQYLDKRDYNIYKMQRIAAKKSLQVMAKAKNGGNEDIGIDKSGARDRKNTSIRLKSSVTTELGLQKGEFLNMKRNVESKDGDKKELPPEYFQDRAGKRKRSKSRKMGRNNKFKSSPRSGNTNATLASAFSKK
eukprot:CAMPEP_0197018168 /NCGR_PEP_ID=MMETSP1380-20130617/79946_1 /TAXON_ID=5936 /ORGANISM="Euplotes crassus, Strain CT5" /LENGTH=149 /DNA_ID=CAMNT_0042445351 /DNA_START=3173 /DNA_END=3619 /DNA_ORIENTATION=-